jgi:hypothetical protein
MHRSALLSVALWALHRRSPHPWHRQDTPARPPGSDQDGRLRAREYPGYWQAPRAPGRRQYGCLDHGLLRQNLGVCNNALAGKMLLFFHANDHGASRATPDDEMSPRPDRSLTPTLSQRARERWCCANFIVSYYSRLRFLGRPRRRYREGDPQHRRLVRLCVL